MDDKDIAKYTENYENAWKAKNDNTGWTIAYIRKNKHHFQDEPITSMISVGHGKPMYEILKELELELELISLLTSYIYIRNTHQSWDI